MIRNSVRFRRQLGLVHQERLEAARVFIAGAGPVLPYLLQNLAFLGFGRGCGEIRLQSGRRLEPDRLRGQFLWRPEDLGLPLGEASGAALERAAGELTLSEGGAAGGADLVFELEPGALSGPQLQVPVLRAATTAFGLYYGTGAWPAAARDAPADLVFAPALASLAGGLLAAEALRWLGLFRLHPIESLALKLELSIPGLPAGQACDVRFDGAGAGTGLSVVRRDGADGPVIEVTLPPELDLTGEIWERLRIVPRGAAPPAMAPRPIGYVSPFERMTPAREAEFGRSAPRVLEGKRILVAGVGGLGAWVAPLLAVSPLRRSAIELLDQDRVEAHNLNRQALYRDADVGSGKAVAGARRLAALDPENHYRGRERELNLDLLAAEPGLGDSDLFVSAFDNAWARTLLGMFAVETGRVVVDVGGGALDGNVNLYRPERHCILCHWNRRRGFEETWRFARDRGANPCQREEAQSPLLAGALCSTSAILASAAAAVALAALAPGVVPSHQMTYLARSNDLRSCPLQEKHGEDGCSHHRHGENHAAHLRRFQDESRHVAALAGASR